MGRRLPDDVVYRIKLYIKDVATTASVIRVLKKTIYKL